MTISTIDLLLNSVFTYWPSEKLTFQCPKFSNNLTFLFKKSQNSHFPTTLVILWIKVAISVCLFFYTKSQLFGNFFYIQMAICPEGQVYNDQTCIWSGGKLLKPDLGYICHVFCVSGRIYDTFYKSVGCDIGILGDFFFIHKNPRWPPTFI